MTVVLTLLLVNAVLGAWDTLWYHEWKAQLPAYVAYTRTELRLHAARDAVYVVLYGGFALVRPSGALVLVVGLLLVAEVVITLCDFVVEDRDRPAIGGIAPGERVLHSLMAIVYGAMLAYLAPELWAWLHGPTALVAADGPTWLRRGALVAAAGIAVSGARDYLCLHGIGRTKARQRAEGSDHGKPGRYTSQAWVLADQTMGLKSSSSRRSPTESPDS